MAKLWQIALIWTEILKCGMRDQRLQLGDVRIKAGNIGPMLRLKAAGYASNVRFLYPFLRRIARTKVMWLPLVGEYRIHTGRYERVVLGLILASKHHNKVRTLIFCPPQCIRRLLCCFFLLF